MADKAWVFLLITILVLVTILFIFAMKYFSAARQARLRIASEEAYRELAERAVKAHEGSAALLGALGHSVSQIDARLANVEKVLKEVE
jgi:hypothetical protein